MNFHIRRVSRNVFDVFQGNQWSTWSRLKSGRNGVYVAQGERLSYSTTKALAAAINPVNEVQDVAL
jgi:hypothetical protein